ncbi:MAG: phospholipase C, phosphocholine-specific [Myxococcales bacterium]
MTHDRRKFLQFLAASSIAGVIPPSISRALSIPPRRRTGTIADVQHIVILMQENRSFDHYFGTLRGVRGFGDRHVMQLPSGNPVWYQKQGDKTILPYHPTAPNLGMQFMQGTPHDWPDTHKAWNRGKYDQWIPAKGTNTMTYFRRDDIPFHYALADAFTICDAYHCSFLGATDPNRYHMFTGWVGNDGRNGGPVLDNSEAGYDWATYPERLQNAGISWKVYQDVGSGLDAAHFWGWGDDAYIGNYGDNSLLYFHQYQNAQPGSPLYEGARRGSNVLAGDELLDDLRADVRAGKLPQVSWIAAPEAYTEHSNWPANYGAWYVSQVLDILTEDPELWSQTAFFVMYDENDGYFDHMVPPTPPATRAEGLSTVETAYEIYGGDSKRVSGPLGLGMRVPMFVISPWSRGGYVNSEVFDHTSLVKFIERRFSDSHRGIIEPNITKWRRAVTGDLTSAFDFRADPGKSTSWPSLPPTDAYEPTDDQRHPDYVPTPPATGVLPKQERGQRPARALPYELDVDGELAAAAGRFALQFRNSGRAAAVFQVRSVLDSNGPWTYTVESRRQLSDSWQLVGEGLSAAYDLSVYGPNGFFRRYAGGPVPVLSLESRYQGDDLIIQLKNLTRANKTVSVFDAYSRRSASRVLRAGDTWQQSWPSTQGWYDLTFEVEQDSFLRQLAGHVETGKDSVSDPAFGA